jgi:hypothetical protein
MNWRLPIALSVSMLATVFLAPLSAQMRGMRAAAPAPRTPASFRAGGRTGFGSRGLGRRGFFPGSRFFPGWAFLPPPFYADFDYDYDYDYGPEAIQAPPPWVVPTQADQPPAPAKPIEPLVLERHGDEWVRIAGYSQSTASAQSMKPSAEQAPNPPSESAGQNNAGQPAAPKLPPAVLVFRDGHQEEIERYTIIGPVIHIRKDYWSTGSWTRKVAIADLDLPATLRVNRERGGKFSLPSGPNEVVVRP